ncbi:MAG: toxin-antitoxin system antidote component [Bacteroidetes bacterium HLUCCA01]|nr:MAG: toxin-antitoxin system antidote component [Bacteroidetes bacterium HLUCCA01]
MKEITLKIPDQKLEFAVELFHQLGLEIVAEPSITEEHKAIVRERIASLSEEELIPWVEARKQLSFKKSRG